MLSFFIQLPRIKDGLPASKQIVLAVRKAIIDGQLVAGQDFPSVRELSQELQISRTTAHKAVTALKDSGFLASRPGIGMVVTVPELSSKEDRLKELQPCLINLIFEAKRLQLKIGDVVEAIHREANSLRVAEEKATLEHDRKWAGHLA